MEVDGSGLGDKKRVGSQVRARDGGMDGAADKKRMDSTARKPSGFQGSIMQMMVEAGRVEHPRGEKRELSESLRPEEEISPEKKPKLEE